MHSLIEGSRHEGSLPHRYRHIADRVSRLASRAKPIQVSNENRTSISITKITKDNVSFSAGGEPGESHNFYFRSEWSEFLAIEITVFGMEVEKWRKDDTLTEVGTVIEHDTPLTMPLYSENLFNESRDLLLGLLRKAIQCNPSLKPSPSKSAG